MTALELIDLIQPRHERTSCTDDNICNGFYSGSGSNFRCGRCALLELAHKKVGMPENMGILLVAREGQSDE